LLSIKKSNNAADRFFIAAELWNFLTGVVDQLVACTDSRSIFVFDAKTNGEEPGALI
jgi:hypothetical protein